MGAASYSYLLVLELWLQRHHQKQKCGSRKTQTTLFYHFSTLPLQQVKLLHVDRVAITIDGQDDR